jgi:cytochrome c oxidase assembly protein subunit 15
VNTRRSLRAFYIGSWSLIAYTVLIILWGAWVRLSGSGDGCGDHWPLCNGEIVPLERVTKTWVEYSHRISTALYGVLILIQIWLSRRHFGRHHPARFWALMTLLFTITEALIGRQLVKSGLVNESTDISRLVVMPLHLVNTSLLLFSGVMTAESVRYGDLQRQKLTAHIRNRGVVYLSALTIVLITGAIAALGSHLMPSESLLHGLTRDLSPDSHPAVRLRILHPLVALALPVAMLLFAYLPGSTPPGTSQSQWYRRFSVGLIVAVGIGLATLSLLAPVWLKITHLFMTNVLVILASMCVFHSLRPVPTPPATETTV